MKLSVIILNYNVSAFLELCLRSVQQAVLGLDAEIIVVDNNSSDDSCEMVRQKFPELTLIANTENSGFPKGNNIGVSQAKGEYICILNPDTVVAEDTFEKVIQFADSKNDMGAVGVRLIDGKGCFLPESKRGVPTPWVAFTKVSGLYKLFPRSKAWNGYYTSDIDELASGKTDVLVGAFMLMKREDYLSVGGFDEDCFMYSDDIDLSYMLLQKGLKNYYFGGTSVIHFKGESTVKDSKYLRRFEQAMNFFYKKHMKSSWWFSFLMNLGVYFFYVIKKFKSSSFREVKIDTSILVSQNVGLKTDIENQTKKTIELVSNLQELDLSLEEYVNQNVEIILDNQSVLFKKIIETIVNCPLKSVRFRIIPNHSSFLIGSDSSDSRGEVIYFKNVSLNQ